MANIRFPLAALVGAISFLSIVFAALRSGSNDWLKSIYSITFVLLLYAAIAARYREAFWYGFAVVGWAFFILGFGPWIHAGLHGTPGATNRLFGLSSLVVEIVTGLLQVKGQASNAQNAAILGADIVRYNREGICHCALTIVFAIVGGLVARRIAAARNS